jgi:excisionase family DNA binding protein
VLIGTPTNRAGLTVNEAAELLGVSRGCIYNILRSGQVDSFTIGRARRIRPESLTAYVDAHTVTGLGREDAAWGGDYE